MGVPVVFVPKARQDPTSDLSPVTINDWLNYCTVPGDELDAQVFGHRDVFRNHTRRWVFEILYKLNDKELAALNAAARTLDRDIAATESEREVVTNALGSETWMAVVAGLIAIEKTIPWRRVATYGTTLLLVVLGATMLVAPEALPGLTVPGESPMPSMSPMGS